jgi:dihydroxy-acid dehydratase
LLRRHRGPAIVFDGVDDLRSRIDDPSLQLTPDTVLVLRNVGPIGGPGMPEVFEFPVPERLRALGVTDPLRISDGRMSGTSAGAIVLHVSPEAAVGGPLALVRDGDEIDLDVDQGSLELLVSAEELVGRRARFSLPVAPPRGYERLHHLHVLQADEGCDFDFLAEQAGAGV